MRTRQLCPGSRVGRLLRRISDLKMLASSAGQRSSRKKVARAEGAWSRLRIDHRRLKRHALLAAPKLLTTFASAKVRHQV